MSGVLLEFENFPQDAVGSAGPLLSIIGFIVLPIVWSVPEALITAELATAFPENSGYVCVRAFILVLCAILVR